MKNYCILINSCDAYKDAWPFFFYLLKQNWQGEMPRIYMNTETFTASADGFDIVTLNSDPSLGWGERLISSLERIPEDYVLMMLEDFYYENPIDIKTIDQCCEALVNNPDILSFQLKPCDEVAHGNSLEKGERFSGFSIRKKFGGYILAAIPTLWRKTDLMKLTNNKDTPWEWEFFGTRRTWLYGKKVYCRLNDASKVFDYDDVHGGAIHRGKWVGYKMEELEKKYDYKLDYGDREIEYDWMLYKEVVVPRGKRIGSIVHNRLKMIYEIPVGLFLRFKK